MSHSPTGLSRRTVVASAGGVAAAGLLTACGSSTTSAPSAAPTPAQPQPSAGSGASGGTALGPAAGIPVGGGTVFADQDVVVTQPTAGEFKAFSATCTHQGCKVNAVANGAIDCPCHGSKFSITDGSVQGGPATRPLPAKQVSVDGDSVVLA